MTVKAAGCYNPVKCKVATGDSGNTVEAAPAVESTPTPPMASYPRVLETATALQPEKTQAPKTSDGGRMSIFAPFFGEKSSTQAKDGSNGASQQTANAEQPFESVGPIPIIDDSNSEGSLPTTKPASGLGAIIAGAFGPHSSSSDDSSDDQASDVEGTQTSAADDSPIVVAGSTILLAPTASAIGADGGSDIQPGQAVTANRVPVITIGSQEITVNSASQVVVESQTLAAGSSAIVVSGSTYSLAPSASAIIINGHTSSLAGLVAPTDAAPAITIDGEPVTINSASHLVIGSQTLTPGSAEIEVSGTTYSLAPSASAIVING